ncbi:MAG TPA: 50S ribosomal protein L32 [Polyangia bacterium]|nr:50S ribosomal protein L32 [Polyangia bacterium]
MAVPKRRKGKGRTAMRRSAWMAGFKAPQTVPCPRCQEPKLPHRLCSNCGYYAGREVVSTDEEA